VYAIEQSGTLWHGTWTIALSLFQERISHLSARAVSVEDPEEFNRVFSDLRAALRGQLAHLREMVDDAKETISRLPFSSNEELRGVRVSDEKASGERLNQDWAALTFSVALEVGHRSATIPDSRVYLFLRLKV
jgi:hypothetical protein